jgi:3-methyladenine DNA glycosylase AlkD
VPASSAELRQVIDELNALADPKRALGVARFFKTGQGQYGEGDRFLGIYVPEIRRVTARHKHLSLRDCAELLRSEWHEHRLSALVILVSQFEVADEPERERIFKLYLRSKKSINNWDLVDASAPGILGRYLQDKPRHLLYEMARSQSLWGRRMAIVSTLAFIRTGDLQDAFGISELLLDDEHDLLHKAVGWMLREAGKQDANALLKFLKGHYDRLPRTALRYAIERFPKEARQSMLRGRFQVLETPAK